MRSLSGAFHDGWKRRARVSSSCRAAGKVGIVSDDGVILIKSVTDAAAFIAQYRALRLWQREAKVHAI